jgi:hypothetical protein
VRIVMNNINGNNRDNNRAEVPNVLDHAENPCLIRRFRIVAKSVCLVFVMSLSACPSLRVSTLLPPDRYM